MKRTSISSSIGARAAVILCRAAIFVVAAAIVGQVARADQSPSSGAGGESYLLRYRFTPGESLRWDVVHRTHVRTSVSGTTQTVETTSRSRKLWRVIEAKPDGSATFEYIVEDVDMRQKHSGQEEVRYNSRTDAEPPPGFGDVAQAVGVPLSRITLDARGKVLRREHVPRKGAQHGSGDLVLPLPEQPVAPGDQWSLPNDIDVTLPTGGTLKIKAVQRCTLEGVRTGVATIRVATCILTPVTDPAVQSQVMQYESSGTVRFDVDAGRILGQQMDVDRRVVGFRGEASSLHYMTRFTEEFLPELSRTASLPAPAGGSAN